LVAKMNDDENIRIKISGLRKLIKKSKFPQRQALWCVYEIAKSASNTHFEAMGILAEASYECKKDIDAFLKEQAGKEKFPGVA